MASFLSNTPCGSWGSQTRYWTLSGDVTRSGNIVTLSNISGYFTATYAHADGISERVCIRDGGNIISDQNVWWNWSGYGTSNTITLNSCSASVGVSDTSHTFNLYLPGDNAYVDFTVTFPAGQTPPQGLSVTVDSSTWDSITLSGNMTIWGTHSGPNQIYALAVFGSTATDWSTEPHNEWATDNPGDTLVYTATIDNNSTKQLGGVDIKGISPYRLGMYARNGDGLTSFTIPSSVFYTAPAPLASITRGTISGGNLSVDITGGDSTVNGTALVYTYYRYSTDEGNTWSNWAATNGATAWTTQTVSIPITGVENVIVEAYQIARYPSYRTGGQSETLRASFLVAPKMYGSVDGFARRVRKLYGPVNGQSKKIIKLYASVNGQSKLIYKE